MQILCLRKAISPSSHPSPACSSTLSGTWGRGAGVSQTWAAPWPHFWLAL